ncbi:unnamed protein product [Ectocarpus sp. 6 AP-2014]
MGTSAEHGGGRITVCCRIRPLGTSTERVPIDTNHRCLWVHSAEQSSVLAGQSGSSSTARWGARTVRGGSRNDRWGFTFDDVLEAGCSQEEVYRKCAKDILESALNGVNGTIMAYGCTGAGKSYTMMGSDRDGVDDANRSGICARALRDVFREAARRRRGNDKPAITIQMSFVEIYNEQLFDLLLPPEAYSSTNQQQRRFSVYGGKESAVGGKRNTPLSSIQRSLGELEVGSAGGSGSGLHAPLTTTPGARQQMADLAIYERPDGSTYVKGLRVHTVSTEGEALRYLRCGQVAREVAEHQFNRVSSRRERVMLQENKSHAVLTVHLGMSGGDEGKTTDEQNAGRGVATGPGRWIGGVATTSKLNLVDLAGSEKSATGATGADAVLHREGRFINKSLTFLEQVTMALADQTREHVPFRSSKLTHFLKDSLGGNCRTLMVACIWPRPDLLQQSLATLKFAARMRCVKNSPIVNERSWSADDEIARLRSQVDLLETQLAAQEAAGGGGRAGCESPAYADNVQQHDRRRRRRVWEEAGRFVLEGRSNNNCGGRRATAEATWGRRRRGKISGGLQATAACGSREEGDGRKSDNLTTAPSEEGDDDEEEEEEEEEEEMAEGEAGDDAGHRGRSNKMVEAKTVSAGEQEERKGRVASGRGRRVISSPFLKAHSNDPRRQLRSLRAAGYAGDFVRALRQLVWEAAAAATASTAAASTSAAAHDSKYGGRSGNELTALAADPGTGPIQQGGGKLAVAAAVRSAVDAVVGRSNRGIDSPESSRRGSRQEDGRREGTRRHEGDRLPFIGSRSDPSTDTWIVARAAGGASCSEEFGRDGDGDRPDGSRPSERLEGGICTTLSNKSGRAGGGSSAKKADNKEGGASRRRSVPGYGGDEDVSNAESTAVTEDEWTGVTESHGTGGEIEETSHRRRRRRCRRRHHLGGAFELFKIGEGKQSNSRLQAIEQSLDAKAAVQRVRSLASDLTGRVNDAKGRIDVARAQLRQHQQRKGSQGDGDECEEEKEREEHISSATLVLTAQLKSRKREYRVLFEKLAGAKAELRKLRQDKQKELAQLAADFECRQEKSFRSGSSSNNSKNSSTDTSASFLPALRPTAAMSLAGGGCAAATTTARCGEENCGDGGGGGGGGSMSGDGAGDVGGRHLVASSSVASPSAARVKAVVLQQPRAASF